MISDESGDDGERHVFISYNWGSKPMVLRVKDRLKDAGYKIWMDVEDMSKWFSAKEKSTYSVSGLSHL